MAQGSALAVEPGGAPGSLPTPFGKNTDDRQPESPPARRPAQQGRLAAAVRRLARPQIGAFMLQRRPWVPVHMVCALLTHSVSQRPGASSEQASCHRLAVAAPAAEPKVDVAFVLLAAVVYGGAACSRCTFFGLRLLYSADEAWQHAAAGPNNADAHERPKLCRGCLLSPLLAVLYFSIGSNFLPGHSAWATLLLWASSQIGAFVAWQLRLPRVIGMLCAGLLMRNVPWNAVDAFNPRWGVQMRAAALATIFLR